MKPTADEELSQPDGSAPRKRRVAPAVPTSLTVFRAIVGWIPNRIGLLASVSAVAGALLIGAVMLILLGASPVEGYEAMFTGAFGGREALISTALKATPLLLVGVGITIAFRANVINIGGEGQIIAGALLGTITALAFPGLPSWALLPLVLIAGILGGAIWGAIPGALRAYLGVNEILSTVMMNVIAVQGMNYLLRGPLIDPAEIERGTAIPQTMRLPSAADLPTLIPGTRLHAGPLIAVLAAAAAHVLLWRTTLGFRLRAVGSSPDAARYAGLPVKRNVVFALMFSGAMAGLAGCVLVFGSESHRFVTDGSSTGFTGGAGFNGIVTALFGALHPLWTIPSSFLFGGLLVGANSLQRAVQVPSALVVALNGIVVILLVSVGRFRGTARSGEWVEAAPAELEADRHDHAPSPEAVETGRHG